MQANETTDNPKLRSAVIDFDAETPTLGGLVGQWTVVVYDGSGAKLGERTSGRKKCVEFATGTWAVQGIRIRYTQRARAERNLRGG